MHGFGARRIEKMSKKVGENEKIPRREYKYCTSTVQSDTVSNGVPVHNVDFISQQYRVELYSKVHCTAMGCALCVLRRVFTRNG